MPPQRPLSHINSDIAIGKLHLIFSALGWSVEDMTKDYGEDLMVRIFSDGAATAHAFYVQAKSISDISRHLLKDGKYAWYAFDVANLELWKDFWEPVFLVLWDAANDRFYWELVQSPEKPIAQRGKATRRVYFPVGNALDAAGLARIAELTEQRHHRLEVEKQGASVLVERLTTLLGVEIDYNPEAGILIVEWPDTEQDVDFTFFGKLAERLQAYAKEVDRPVAELVPEMLRNGIRRMTRESEG